MLFVTALLGFFACACTSLESNDVGAIGDASAEAGGPGDASVADDASGPEPVATDGGKLEPSPATVPPTSGAFATLGARRGAGTLVLYDDGFELGERACAAAAALCLAGAITP